MRSKINNWLLDPPKALVFGLAAITLIGTILLTLPISTRDGLGLSWNNAIFTATSATTVTGLVVKDTGSTFTLFGQMVIISLIQVGGIGFVTFATLFALLMRKKISLKERLLLQQSLNQTSIEGIVRLVKMILIFTLVIEVIGGLLLAIRFAFDMPLAKAIYYGMFHSISNFNNGGFDLTGEFSSFISYAEDPLVNIVLILLIILGSIGFIVISDLYEYRYTRRLQLHTKVVLWANAILTLVSAVFIFLLEYNNPETMQSLSPLGKFLSSIYQAVTPRSGGSSTLPIGFLQQSTLLLIIVLMFIGGSPGSTGGGIKVTTFATLLGAVWAQMTGKEDVIFFRQRIIPDMIYRSLTVTMSGLFMVMAASMTLLITEPGVSFIVILFETTSAFATCGLSMGLTPDLSELGKYIVSITMFIGRVGPLTIALALAQRKQKEYYRYPKGKILIG